MSMRQPHGGGAKSQGLLHCAALLSNRYRAATIRKISILPRFEDGHEIQVQHIMHTDPLGPSPKRAKTSTARLQFQDASKGIISSRLREEYFRGKEYGSLDFLTDEDINEQFTIYDYGECNGQSSDYYYAASAKLRHQEPSEEGHDNSACIYDDVHNNCEDPAYNVNADAMQQQSGTNASQLWTWKPTRLREPPWLGTLNND